MEWLTKGENFMTITFLRHAETEFNKNGLFCGTSDCNITEEGSKLAKNLRNEFPEFDFYYCSPLKRTQQTLQAIFPNVNFIVDKRIIEICLGVWEGVPKTSVNQELRSKFKKGIYAPEGAESNESVKRRASSFLAYIAKNYTNEEKILVVTHNGFMRTLANMLGIKPISNNLEYFTIDLT